MPFIKCSVKSCKINNECKIFKSPDIRFFRLPSFRPHHDAVTRAFIERQREMWLSRIQIPPCADSNPKIFVCSSHFVTGKPSYFRLEHVVDWAPSLKLKDNTSHVLKSHNDRMNNAPTNINNDLPQGENANINADSFNTIFPAIPCDDGSTNTSNESVSADYELPETIPASDEQMSFIFQSFPVETNLDPLVVEPDISTPSCSLGCNSKNGEGIRLFAIPKNELHESFGELTKSIYAQRRELWLQRINNPNRRSCKFVCSKHFVKGKPSYHMSVHDPDWAPSIALHPIEPVIAGSEVDSDLPVTTAERQRKRIEVVDPCNRHDLTTMNFVCSKHFVSGSPTSESTDVDWISSLQLSLLSKNHESNATNIKEDQNIPSSNDVKMQTELLQFKLECAMLKADKLLMLEKLELFSKEIVDLKGKVEKLEKINHNFQTLGALQHVMRNNPCEDSPHFVSSNATNDYNYCIKPGVQKGQHHIYLDHNYCQLLHSNVPSRTSGNISENTMDMETSIKNREDACQVVDDLTEMDSETDSCDSCETGTKSITFLTLPIDEGCSTCDEVASLKSELEQKSRLLETGINGVNSLKQELELAKEHISNLRAQLERNTRTLLSCLSLNGKSS